jgi:DNA-binding NarL/FixJ family response regulator
MLVFPATLRYNPPGSEGDLAARRGNRVGDCGFILVVDHDLVTRGLVQGVGARIGYEIRAASDGDEALEFLNGERPALAIVEVELPRLNGLAFLRELQGTFGDDLPVILTSAERDTAHDRTVGLLLGADAYLVKPLDPAELGARIRRLLRHSGESLTAAHGNGDAHGNGNAHANGRVKLTPRERQILTLLADGQTEKQIAAALFISPKTVATHIQRLLPKLGVNSRAQAVAAAYRDGLIEPDVRAHAPVALAEAH